VVGQTHGKLMVFLSGASLALRPAGGNSLRAHGFLSGAWLALRPAGRGDVVVCHVDSGLFLALLMTLNQTDLSRYKFHGSYLGGSGAQSH